MNKTPNFNQCFFNFLYFLYFFFQKKIVIYNLTHTTKKFFCYPNDEEIDGLASTKIHDDDGDDYDYDNDDDNDDNKYIYIDQTRLNYFFFWCCKFQILFYILFYHLFFFLQFTK